MPFDAFLKLDGIAGESTDAKHKNEIEVLSFGFGVTRPGTPGSGGGAGGGKAQFNDFFFTASTQMSTPNLLLAAAAGTHLKSAVLSVRRASGGKQEFLKWTLSDVQVTSLQTGGSAAGDAQPVDSVALNFRKLAVEYRPVSPKGALGPPVKTGWDLAKNVKL